MHRDFSEWYRIASIVPNDDLLKRRWTGVEKWCSQIRASHKLLFDTLRIFIGTDLENSDTAIQFTTSIKEFDSAFSQRNRFEIQVLAGSSLVNCFSSGDDTWLRLASALALISTKPISHNAPREVYAEVITLAQQYIDSASVTIRERDNANVVLKDASKKLQPLIAQLEKVNPTEQPADFHASILAVVKDLDAKQKALLSSYALLLDNQLRSDEECNMLWWFQSEYSRDLSRKWTEVVPSAIPLVSAKELADLTHFLPGPKYAITLLKHVATSVRPETATIADAINSVPIETIDAYTATPVSKHASELTPIWNAIMKRRSARDAETWSAFVKSSTGLPTDMSMPADQLSVQMYNETTLLKTLAEEK
ncbi:MAG TPA: GTPase-associated system all-helical protein GASH [bacterium]|jgi:hypothetical protein